MKPKDKRASSKTRPRKATSEKEKTKSKLVLARRSYGYLVGIAILPAATLGFLVGFVSPYWHFRRNSSGSTMVHGLWLVCEQDSNARLVSCEQTIIRAQDWLRGMQFLEVMALSFLLLACLFAVLLNCTTKHVHSRLLEVFSGAGATFAIFGVFGYLFLTLSPRDSAEEVTYNWAFGVNMTGSLLAVIAAILIATNNPAPPTPKSSKEDRTALWVNGQQGGDKALQPYKALPPPPPPPKKMAIQRELVPVRPPPPPVLAPPPPLLRLPPPPPPVPVVRLLDPRRNQPLRGQSVVRPVWLLPALNHM